MKVKAIEFSAPSVVRVVDIEIPDPRPDDAVVRTLFSGISAGTESLAFKGAIDPEVVLDESIGALEGTFRFPFRYGYSCVGAMETDSGGLRAGQLVFCLHPHQSVLVRPAREMVALPAIEPRIATMLPVVETGLQIALDAGDEHNGAVLVFGLGAIGIVAAALLVRRGVGVIGIEPRSDRREAAAAFGVDAVAPDAAPEEASMVVDCSGDPEVLAESLDLLVHEGTALVASWYGKRSVALPLGGAFHRRRLTIRSTQVSSIPRHLQGEWSFERRTETAVGLLTELPMNTLATHTFPFDRAQDAFDAIAAGEEGVIHVALSYP